MLRSLNCATTTHLLCRGVPPCLSFASLEPFSSSCGSGYLPGLFGASLHSLIDGRSFDRSGFGASAFHYGAVRQVRALEHLNRDNADDDDHTIEKGQGTGDECAAITRFARSENPHNLIEKQGLSRLLSQRNWLAKPHHIFSSLDAEEKLERMLFLSSRSSRCLSIKSDSNGETDGFSSLSRKCHFLRQRSNSTKGFFLSDASEASPTSTRHQHQCCASLSERLARVVYPSDHHCKRELSLRASIIKVRLLDLHDSKCRRAQLH